jgi:hypothetical protein
MITLTQLLDAVPLPVLLLAIICATVVVLVALVLCALFPGMGTTIADIVYAWRTSRRPGRRHHRPRLQSRANQGKRGKVR